MKTAWKIGWGILLGWWGMMGGSVDAKTPVVAIIVSDDHYRADTLLPQWGEKMARERGWDVRLIHGHGTGDLENMEALKEADIMLLYLRRVALPTEKMQILRDFLKAKKPLIAFRTSSHAFSLSFDGKKEAPEGYSQWKNFDAEVLGGNYHNHGPNHLPTRVTYTEAARNSPFFRDLPKTPWISQGSLYFTSPVDEKAVIFQYGSIEGRTEPLTWLRTSPWGGAVFYTTLGHWNDFQEEAFLQMIVNVVETLTKE